MFEAAAVGSLLAGGPVVAILGMIYNVIILGPTGFLGSAVFILFYPAMVSEPLSAASWSLLHRGQSACAEHILWDFSWEKSSAGQCCCSCGQDLGWRGNSCHLHKRQALCESRVCLGGAEGSS